MQREQPIWSPGYSASWDGSPIWPGSVAYIELAMGKIAAGKALNFTVAQEWFEPRIAAWKVDKNTVITTEEVLTFFSTDAAWIPRP